MDISTMADSLEIESMFLDSNRVDEASYSKIEYLELYDQMNGNYSTGQVQFNTDAQMKHHIVYADSYAVLPIKCTKSTDGRMAVKNSILSFIQGIQIESASGTSIANEQLSTPIVANLRLLLDSSLDFREANELMYFGQDKTIERNVSGADVSILGSVGASAPSGKGKVADALDFLKNPALCDRITVLTNRSVFTAAGGGLDATQSFVAYIPLRFIHDFFRQMDFPMVNLSLRITFNISGCGSYTSFSPWTTPVFSAHASAGALSVPAARVSPANAGDPIVGTLAAAVPSPVVASTTVLPAFTDRFGGKFAPRLFLKSVQFTKEVAESLAKKIVGGFTKQLTYTVSNYYNQAILAGAADQGVNWPFVQGIIRPTRMWVFPLAKGTLGATTNTFPSRTGPVALRNTNIVLNGDNFYNNMFRTQEDYWRELKTQLIAAGRSTATGTPLSYDDFISGCAYYCFDLSRNLTVKTNNLCTLALVSDLVDQTTGSAPAGDIDMYVIVERLQVITLKVSEGGVEVMTKQGGPES